MKSERERILSTLCVVMQCPREGERWIFFFLYCSWCSAAAMSLWTASVDFSSAASDLCASGLQLLVYEALSF
jgi:hypothetical protein